MSYGELINSNTGKRGIMRVLRETRKIITPARKENILRGIDKRIIPVRDRNISYKELIK